MCDQRELPTDGLRWVRLFHETDCWPSRLGAKSAVLGGVEATETSNAGLLRLGYWRCDPLLLN